MENRDTSKLPKWAQLEIERLQRNAEHYQRERRAIDAGESNVLVVDYANGNINLPPNSTIRFVMGPGENEYIEAGVNHYHKNAIYINSGTGSLYVRPVASNALTVGRA